MLIYTTAIFRVVGGWMVLRNVELLKKPVDDATTTDRGTEVKRRS